MDDAIRKQKVFEQGQSIDFEIEQTDIAKKKAVKITAVSDNMKFGRGKKSVATHFQQQDQP